MKNQWIVRLTIGILVAIFILVSPAWFQLEAFESNTNGEGRTESFRATLAWRVDPPSGTPLGEYTGSVTLTGVYSGVHSDENVTPEEQELGYIDLALNLSRDGNEVTGFVIFDETLLYPKEHTIMVTPVGPPVGARTPTPEPEALDMGPRVSGRFNGTTMSLTSDKFTESLIPRETLEDEENLPERQITRQFVLKTTQVENNGVTLIGEYRETIWGYSPYPSTVVGTFQLQRPDFSSTD